MVIIIGRGHSGTRIPSKLLYTNNYITGSVNSSFDMIPANFMYKAAQIYSNSTTSLSKYEWKFNTDEPTNEFKQLVENYLKPILDIENKTYFKLPETTLCYPWITQMFPNAHFIHWIRDPRDFCIHGTDRFNVWKIKSEKYDPRKTSAVNCKYQWDIVENTPKPINFIRIKYEDFCLNQTQEIKKLNLFLNDNLKSTETKTTSVQKWKKDPNHIDFPFLKDMILKNYTKLF